MLGSNLLTVLIYNLSEITLKMRFCTHVPWNISLGGYLISPIASIQIATTLFEITRLSVVRSSLRQNYSIYSIWKDLRFLYLLELSFGGHRTDHSYSALASQGTAKYVIKRLNDLILSMTRTIQKPASLKSIPWPGS